MSNERTGMTRRQWLFAVSVATIARPRSLILPTDVEIVEFTDAGQRKQTVRVPKIVKSESEWRKQLTPLAYEIAREKGTETPFTGAYWDLHDKGIFRCVCCDTALFSSAAK